VNPVVSNASPLINLARVQRFDLLKHFYGRVTIPTAVYDEVVIRGQERDGSRDLRNAAWITGATPKDDLAVSALAAQLDRGEASAIILARELDAELLLIDEIRGRRVAETLGVKITGTPGILARAKREGLIPNLRDEIARLQSQGTWIHPKLVQDILELVGEIA
jgi:predicted nucleic acid-binding protein